MAPVKKRPVCREVPYSYNTLRTKGTGGLSLRDEKIKVVPFGKFNIGIKLNENNQFKGIVEVRERKDFRKANQRIVKGFHDVEDFYK